MKANTSGRGWAYASAILGGSISIAANIAHSFIHPHGAPATWLPEPGAVVGAVVWPVVLFFAVETLARTPWPKKVSYHLLRWIGLPPVAFVAALVSYRHLSGLLEHYGEDRLVVVLGPIAIDGLMIMATGALIATAPTRAPSHVHDQVVTANPAPTTPIPTTPPTPVLAPLPAPAPAATAVKKAPAKKATPRKAAAKKATTPATTSTPTRSSVATQHTEQANPPAQRHAVPNAPARATAPSTPDSSVATVDAAPPPKAPVPAALLTRARHLADAHQQATNEPITKGALAVQLRVNTDTAEQLLAVLGLDANRPTHTTTRNSPDDRLDADPHTRSNHSGCGRRRRARHTDRKEASAREHDHQHRMDRDDLEPGHRLRSHLGRLRQLLRAAPGRPAQGDELTEVPTRR